jgi:STE24 endopeptidase
MRFFYMNKKREADVNIYMAVILIALILDFVLELVADILNMGALQQALPEEFKRVYNEDEYARSQEYTRVRTRFGVISSAFDLTVLLCFWFVGGFNALDLVVRGYGFSPLLTGLIYVGALVLLRTLLAIPFNLYATFVIEERFGFNKTTVRTFILDLVKGALLTALLGGALLATVLVIFDLSGPRAWLYCWVAVSLFTLFLQFIAPTWLLPLFNKFVPLADGELKERIMRYAQSVSFRLEKIFVMDGSRRSGKSNAFFTGFGRHKRIALYDTLIAKHSVPELEAILAHEIGHYKKKHIQQGLVLTILHMGVMLFLLSIFVSHKGLFDAFFMDHASVYAGLIFFGLLLSPIEMLLAVLLHSLSRKNEYQADRFAAETIADPAQMIAALKNLARDNLANLTPHPFQVLLHYSHPPVLKRIQAIRKHMAGVTA